MSDTRAAALVVHTTGPDVLHKLPGRVGDTPLCGAGFYAHPQLGACGTTGVGEAILTHVLAFEALRRASERPGEAAIIAASLCAAASRHHNGAAVGLILVRPDGEVAIVHCSEHMSWALAIGDAAPDSGLRRDLSPGTSGLRIADLPSRTARLRTNQSFYLPPGTA